MLGDEGQVVTCPECNGPLADDWHGLAACFCTWGGKRPTLLDLDALIAAYDGPRH